jgi:hypothetical protein
MDGPRFDAFTRAVASGTSRRGFLRGFVGAAAALIAAPNRGGAQAACVAYGRPCAAGATCCNGAVCSGGACRCPAGAGVCNTTGGPVCKSCPPDQFVGPGCRCLCKVGGREPGPAGCPCPNGQVKCGTDCIPEENCCTAADCDDLNPCTVDTCQGGTCVHTPVAPGQPGVCPSGQVCCSGACTTVAGFCPPEQTFADCECTCPGATKCGPECCVVGQEVCIDDPTEDFCCPAALACENDTVCCDDGEACCVVSGSETCVDTATFCPPEQTFSACACICDAGETICGSDCCVDGQEDCIDNVCCPAARSCPGNTVCCPEGQVCIDDPVTDFCCPIAQVCEDVNGRQICCTGGAVCIDNACCPAAQVCQNNTACCQAGTTCAFDGDGFPVCCAAANLCGPVGAQTCCGAGQQCCFNAFCFGGEICEL